MRKTLVNVTLIAAITTVNVAAALAQTGTTPAPNETKTATHKESLREEIREEIKSFNEKMKAIYNEYKQKKAALKNSLSSEAKQAIEERRERKGKMERHEEKDMMENKN